jgi:hypothetical protein
MDHLIKQKENQQKKFASNKQSLIEIHLNMQMDSFLMFNIQ